MATEQTSALASSGLETSSAPSTPTSQRSITTSPSATAGERPKPSARAAKWRRRLHRLAASLTLKLLILVGIFIALPIILYGQFESADRQMRDLVIRAIQDRSSLIADALTPTLRSMDPTSQVALNADLAKYSSDGTILKLMFQPGVERDPGRFYFVASAPQIRTDDVIAELDQLRQRGILQRLSDACMWDASNEIRYKQADGTVELLTSIMPIRTAAGCWVLTSTHATSEFLNTSIGRPYWETREIRVAAAIYLVLAVVALLVAVSIRLSLRRFRDVAAEISQGRIGDYAFTQRNVVPELSSVARDFDKLVQELWRVSQQIRQSAEDKAHSFKTPLAAIRSALEPVRRVVPQDNPRARRALDIIDSSLGRLLDLVIAAQRHDISTAELIEAPRVPTDFTQLVGDAALHFREILASKDIRLIRRLDEHAIVRAGHGMLEVVLQNVLENAISFSQSGGTIVVTLTNRSETVELQIDDEGPGVDPAKLDHLFERYFSSRPRHAAQAGDQPAGHAGLGLWIVRRNVEALGGRVSAVNRIGGGLSVTIIVPRSGP
jgi:two-component system sensor histidine kinase ChvG